MANEEPALTMKEAIMEVRKDLKEFLQDKLPALQQSIENKADRDDLARKADRAEFDELKKRVEVLETAHAVSGGIDNFKKVVIGTAVTALLAMLGFIGSIVLRLLPPSAHH